MTNNKRRSAFFRRVLENNFTLENLVCYWDFEGSRDEVINGIPITSLTGAFYGPGGIIGDDISMSSTSFRALYPDSSLYSFTDGSGNDIAFSISLWAKFYGKSSVGNWLVNKRASGTSDEWQFILNSVGLQISLASQGSYSSYIGKAFTFNPTLNVYYHIVITYDGSKSVSGFKCYVNNSELTVGSNLNVGTYLGMANTTAPLAFCNGAWNIHPTQVHNGRIDEIGIWKGRALDSTSVSALYNSGSGLTYPF